MAGAPPPIDRLLDDLSRIEGGEGTNRRIEARARVFRAPGRVNLMGDHTDYNGGLVMPMAIDYETRIAAVAAESTLIRSIDQPGDFALPDSRPAAKADTPEWIAYPDGVLGELRRAGHDLVPMAAVIASSVPLGRGLSSSAALEVAIALAAVSLSDIRIDRLELAEICRLAEERVAGVECGIMDQLISLLGMEGSALIIDCSTVVARPVPIPEWAGVIAIDSGIERSLTTSHYNERRSECREALGLVRANGFDVESLSEITADDFAAATAHLSPRLTARVRHVVSENGRVRELASIFAAESISNSPSAQATESLAAIFDSSQMSLVDDYQAGHPNTNKLVEIAGETEGCIGARQTGAGWGGSVVALAMAEKAQDIASEISARYEAETGTSAPSLVCRPSPGACELDPTTGEPLISPEA